MLDDKEILKRIMSVLDSKGPKLEKAKRLAGIFDEMLKELSDKYEKLEKESRTSFETCERGIAELHEIYERLENQLRKSSEDGEEWKRGLPDD